ncbi:MAG: TonB family protein [Parvularculaceae bacterium]
MSGSAEIVDMAGARARLAADAGEFEHVGYRLAAIRESQGITLRDAAARTHIRENHLVAIETVNAAALPARPYALGFVRTYAEFLELDPRPIVEQFKFDAGYDAPQVVEAEKFRAAEETAVAGPSGLSLPVFIAILAFILWCAWQITLTKPVVSAAATAETVVRMEPALTTPTPTAPAGDVVAARLIEQVEPVYPHGCAPNAQSVETVTIVYSISAAGRVSGERVAGSSNDCFDAAALNALRRWKYQPQTVDGAAKPVFDQVRTFRFQRPL